MILKGKYSRNDLNRLLDSYRLPEGKDRNTAWNEFFEKLNERTTSEKANRKHNLKPFAWVAIAASVAVFALLSAYIYLYRMGNVEIATCRGQHLTAILPDSSRVTLNAETSIKYNRNRWFADRSVSLNGEALFEVRKGSSFYVTTPKATTRVLGTVFNVYSRKGLVKVTCFEGKVSVMAKGSQKQTVLTKGMEAKTMGYELKVTTNYISDKKDMPKWIEKEFYFTKAPIVEVIDELERQFDVDIFLDTDTGRLYSGLFRADNIEDALNLVCMPLELNWTYNGQLIVITNNNSNK